HRGPMPALPDLQFADLQPDVGRAASGVPDGHGTRPGVRPRPSTTAASPGRRSTPSATRPIASVKIFVPMVSRAISAAGTITAQGFRASPARFSLIMVPQLAAGGGGPNPRNASPAMTMIE